MKKLTKFIICFLSVFLIFFLFSFNAYAQEPEESLPDVNGIMDGIDNETQNYLEEAGVNDPTNSEVDLGNIWGVITEMATDKLSKPFVVLVQLLLVIVASSFLNSFDFGENLVGPCGAIIVALIVMPNILHVISLLTTLATGVSTFLFSAIPIYATLLIYSGSVSTGATYGSLTLFTANIISFVSSKISVPLLAMMAGLSITSIFSHFKSKSILDAIYSFVKWILIFAVSSFSAILSIQTAISGSSDAVVAKTAKLIASSTIPIVGGAFGDGVVAVQQSVNFLKGSAGAFGIIALVFIFAPIAIEALCWSFILKISNLACDLFGAKEINEFISSCNVIFKIIIATIISLFVVSVVTAAIVIYAGT